MYRNDFKRQATGTATRKPLDIEVPQETVIGPAAVRGHNAGTCTIFNHTSCVTSNVPSLTHRLFFPSLFVFISRENLYISYISPGWNWSQIGETF